MIREKNPFGETCGITCAANQLCQRDCYRRDFAGTPVKIAELQRRVCEAAGEEGWPRYPRAKSGQAVAVIGAGPAAMSCAYYLSMAGCKVTVWATENRPCSQLLDKTVSNGTLQAALQRDLIGILSSGVMFTGSQPHFKIADCARFLQEYSSVFFTRDQISDLSASEESSAHSDLVTNSSRIFIGEEFSVSGLSLVEAAAQGRKYAMKIWKYLSSGLCE